MKNLSLISIIPLVIFLGCSKSNVEHVNEARISKLENEVKSLKEQISKHQKLNDNKPTQLTAEALFQKKQECQKYKQQIEKEFEAKAVTLPNGTTIENELDKIFYSSKANSCLYVAKRIYSGHGKYQESLRLVDALSGEVLLEGGGGAPESNEYYQKKEAFWNAVKSYESEILESEKILEIVKTRKIELVGQDGKVRANFYLGVHDAPNFVLYDKEGQSRFNFGLAPAGNGGIEIIGIDGKRWTAP